MTRADLEVGVPDDGLMGPRSDQPKRRTFTAEYKLAMVVEYDAATEPGAKGALLRREGLYSSHIIEWRRARDAGALAGVADKPRTPARSDAEREADGSLTVWVARWREPTGIVSAPSQVTTEPLPLDLASSLGDNQRR